MVAFLRFFWYLCLLRVGPENSPNSPATLILVILVYISLAALAINLDVNTDIDFVQALAWAQIPMAIFAFNLWLLLRSRGLEARFVPTLFSWLGCNILLILPKIPISRISLTDDAGNAEEFFVVAVNLFLLGWQLVVGGFILHRAADVSRAMGSFLTFCMLLIAAVITYLILPLPGNFPGSPLLEDGTE